MDAAGNLFIADQGYNRIRRVDAATGIITTVAGGGSGLGDGGLATSATLASPSDVALDAGGNLFIADIYHFRIRRVDAATGIITTVAGGGSDFGDGGPATSASLGYPYGIAIDAVGNLFIADADYNRVRRVDAATGIITTVAGNGTYGYYGDGGLATVAALRRPADVALDPGGNLLIVDYNNQRIRRVDVVTGIITTVAGNGNWGF